MFFYKSGFERIRFYFFEKYHIFYAQFCRNFVKMQFHKLLLINVLPKFLSKSKMLYIYLIIYKYSMKSLNRFVVLVCVALSLSSSAQIGAGGFKINENGDPLPNVLLNFDAIFDNTKVELTWSSDTENNNNLFVVEKSKDAMNFEALTSIKGFGNNSNIMSYFDVDYTPFEGISFYRLTQINETGKILSSRLVSINNKISATNLAMNQSSMYDNTAALMGSENKEVLVVLRNEKGEESYSKVVVDEKYNVLSSDNTTKLNNGIYTVIASSDNKLYSQKLVVR